MVKVLLPLEPVQLLLAPELIEPFLLPELARFLEAAPAYLLPDLV